MGKKASGKHYTSKGERRSSVSTASNDPSDKMINAQKAWIKGGNPWITIANPNKEQTNKKFIRVRMNDLMHGNAKDLRKSGFIIQGA
jgi:hypothetical protein